MSTTINYKGDTIATVSNETKTLLTAGTWLEDDIELVDVSGSGMVIAVEDTEDEAGGIIRTISAVDISNDTVTASKLLQGYTAHNAAGEAITGTYVPSGIVPSGTITLSQNGTYDVTDYASAVVDVSGGAALQAKTNISPTESSQTIQPDTGYDGLSSVQINAISSTYVGSGISRKSSSDLTVSGGTVTAPAGYYEAAASKSVTTGTAGTPSASKGTVSNHSVSITPSVTNVTGYITGGTKTGTAVSVSASELVSGNKEITGNGTNIDVTNYSTVSVAVPGDTPTIDSLSVTPTESTQTFNSSSVDGYKPVTVSAISSTYVGSGIGRRGSSDLTVSGGTVTAPSGYYEEAASKPVKSTTPPTTVNTSITSGYTSRATIPRYTSDRYLHISDGYNDTKWYYTITGTPDGTVTAPSSITGTSATVSTGTNTLTLTKTVSVTPNVTTAGYISTGTAGNSSVSLTASVTTKGATTYHPSTTSQSIASGTYLTGAQTINPVTISGLSASNILSGVTVKVGDSSDDDCVTSVTGSLVVQDYYTGSSAPSSSLGNNGDIYLQN